MNAHPAVSISNYDIWEYILAFLKPTEEFMPAMVCQDFYQILRAKRAKRGQAVWITDVTVFCKTPEWAKFIILTSRQDLQGNWATIPHFTVYRNRSEFKMINVYDLIDYITLSKGYYETHKYISYILHYGQDQKFLALKLPENNYGFLRNMLDDLIPVSSPGFVCKVIETLNFPLIKTLLTTNPAVNRQNFIQYYYTTHEKTINNVLDHAFGVIYTRQHEIDIANARDILNFVVDMYGKYSKLTGPFKYTLDEYILKRGKLSEVIFLHEVIGVPGCPGIAILALKYDRLDILEYTLAKRFPLSISVAETIIKIMPDLAKKYNIVAGTE